MLFDARLDRGRGFETKVLDVLKLLPGAKVREHVRVGGKDVDALAVFEEVLGGTVVVAFECKDHARPLSRAAVAQILADYELLIHRRLVDRFCLVTTKGIVANALECFDGKRVQHLTYGALLSRLIDPSPLVSNMKGRFSLDELDKYYIPARCQSVELKWIGEHFPLYYNPFVDLAASSSTKDLDFAALRWRRYSPSTEPQDYPSLYSAALFREIIVRRTTPRIDFLEPLVTAWAEDDSIQQSLALLGSYGTGKSSFARRFAFLWATKYERGETERIPFLIELRHFGSHQDIEGLITHELVNRHGARHGSYDLFQALNREGKFLLILDGFDEMKQGMTNDALLFNFNEINRLYSPRSKILLCGRPTIFASDSEQTAIFAGMQDTSAHSAQYIQIVLAHFFSDDILTFIRRYGQVKHPKAGRKLRKVIASIRDELPHNEELADLLSRPVHLPMLVAVLPDWKGRISELRRAKLYQMFIDRTIAREVLKARPGTKEGYEVATRRQFASELAIAMFRLGDSRSIRYSEIPDELIKGFRRAGQSLEGVKRDLISACFLERKAPDLLFFGHKSFAEYLAAERVVSLMASPDPDTNRLGIKITPEILSFIVEMASCQDWSEALKAPKENSRLLYAALTDMVRTARYSKVLTSVAVHEAMWQDTVLRSWYTAAQQVPENVAYRFAEYLEIAFAAGRECPGECAKLLELLLGSDSDLVAVHACRALVVGEMIKPEELEGRIGGRRFGEWQRAGWLPAPRGVDDDKIGLQKWGD